MAALAQPTPRVKRRGKLSELDKMRDKTRYFASTSKRPTGYAPLFHAALAEMARLTNGHGFKILMFIWNLSLGRVAKEGQPFFEVTEPVSTATLAELACCDERTVQRELKDMERREIISIDAVKKGAGYEISPLFRTWEKLPSYSAGPVEEPEQEGTEIPAEDEVAAKDRVTTRVTKKPVHVAAGKPSKDFAVECGVSALRFDVRKLDADCSAVVQNGVLCVTLEPKWNAKNGVSAPYIPNDLQANSRHGCRQEYEGTAGTSKQRKQETKGENKQKSSTRPARSYECDHPRAEELAAIFDPLLLKWCGKSLSEDISCLQSACEAIGAADHDFLVHAAITRGARCISSPKAVVSICKEIAGNFLRKGSLPANVDAPTLTKGQQRAQTLMKGLDMLDKMRRKA